MRTSAAATTWRIPARRTSPRDLALDQLPPPTTLRSQADYLRLHGLDELVEEGRRVWAAKASAPDLAALAARSRITEAEALIDADGLGAFTVAEWVVG